jgi:hypothetical protein
MRSRYKASIKFKLNKSSNTQRKLKPATATRVRVSTPGTSIAVGRAALNYLIDLTQGGISLRKRRRLNDLFKWLLKGQYDRPLEKTDLCSIASKIYRAQLTAEMRKELCGLTCDLFTYCLAHRWITPLLFEQVMLFFRMPNCNLPPGVMPLDQIRTALFEAPTRNSQICIVLALTTDISLRPVSEVRLADVFRQDQKELQIENLAGGAIRSLDSWLMALPRKTGLLVPEDEDYRSACKTLATLGCGHADTFKRTRIAYRSALMGATARFATGGCMSPQSVKKYSVSGLDWWSGYAFHFGLTPESCGIADWMLGEQEHER